MTKENTQPRILIAFHTSSNAGYAMSALELMFFRVCADLAGTAENIHFSFRDLAKGMPKSLPENFAQVIALNYQDEGTYIKASEYIIKNKINCVLCFDVQPNAKVCRFWRENGVKKIVSYWGSTISSKNSPLKLLAKKIEVLMTKAKPNHFIFESTSMQDYALKGRGILQKNTSVIPTGVDENKFKPNAAAAQRIRDIFKLPAEAKIVFYSGHMEPRKGVQVIVDSAIVLVDKKNIKNIYFLICGNRPGEELPYLKTLANKQALDHVIFAGYRNDLPDIMPGCDLGVVASTGWDSFPMSTLEMAASGLPIVVSRLQGLVETLSDGETGYTFTPGNAEQLADKILQLTSNAELYQKFSQNSVTRILQGYTLNHQFNGLKACLARFFF